MISLEKWIILTPLQKLTNNVGDLGKIIVATGFECLPKKQKIAHSGHSGYKVGEKWKQNNLVKWFDRISLVPKRFKKNYSRGKFQIRSVKSSVIRLGDFWKFLSTNFITKVAQIFGGFWAILKNVTFFEENLMWLHYFLNISATFNSYIWSHWSRDSLSLIGTSKKNFSSKIEFQLYGSNITFKGDFSILILQRSYVLQQQ